VDAYTMDFIAGKMVITHPTGVVNEYDIEHLQELRNKIMADNESGIEDLSFVDNLILQAEQSVISTKEK